MVAARSSRSRTWPLSSVRTPETRRPAGPLSCQAWTESRWRRLTASFAATGHRQTRAIGRALGREARPGTLLALIGPLGAGKTQLAKGVAEGLGVPSRRQQPHLRAHERACRPAAPLPRRCLPPRRTRRRRWRRPPRRAPGGGRGRRRVGRSARRLAAGRIGSRSRSTATAPTHRVRTLRWAASGIAHERWPMPPWSPDDRRHRGRLHRPVARPRRSRRHASSRKMRWTLGAPPIGRAAAAPRWRCSPPTDRGLSELSGARRSASAPARSPACAWR